MSRASDVAVVGAGVAGRLAALRLARAGARVTLLDRGAITGSDDPASGRPGCSYVAAGMLSPLAEALDGEAALYDLGHDAARRWEDIAATLPLPVPVGRKGALAVARAEDDVELEDLRARALRRRPDAPVEVLDRAAIRALEPALADACGSGLLLCGDGQIDNWAAMAALAAALQNEPRVTLAPGTDVRRVAPRIVSTGAGEQTYDAVLDCRGLGAQGDLRDLRGVRGELLILRAPEVRLTRPVRVMHQRHPVYAVPRGEGRIVIGATCVESDGAEPPTVTAVLELLTAVYNLHPGFRHAHVERLLAGVRPAFPDNLPSVRVQPGLVRINGLYRHGWLLAPLATAAAAAWLLGERVEAAAATIMETP